MAEKMGQDYRKLENVAEMSLSMQHPIPNNSRLPYLFKMWALKPNTHKTILRKFIMKRKKCIIYDKIQKGDVNNEVRNTKVYQNVTLCICFSFLLGLVIGGVVAYTQNTNSKLNTIYPQTEHIRNLNTNNNNTEKILETLENDKDKQTDSHVSFAENRYDAIKTSMKDLYPKSITENMKNILKDKESRNKNAYESNNTKDSVPSKTTILYDNIYWGPLIEDSLPKGYDTNLASIWEKYVDRSEIVKMEPGCGRMQNRLVTFSDGLQACVRYRHNNDQIQGEIFSFYLGRHLKLDNFAPSVLKIVDVKDKLWKNVASDIVEASWKLNKAVVLTQFIPNLNPAMIPLAYRPDDRHLNKYDIKDMMLSVKPTDSIIIDRLEHKPVKAKGHFDNIDSAVNKISLERFIELAQWSDLIIFDFLTANLDRIVNNLFNHQWNINIMDAPAHNLAKKIDSGLLIFLDNESSLLHGYRLLKKYDMYHNLMLDHLCVFRKSTVDILRQSFQANNIGVLLNDVFREKNDALVRDNLPQFPNKNAKILQERIGKVLDKVKECERNYSIR